MVKKNLFKSTRLNFILVLMMVVVLSGCTSVIDLTSEEEDLIAEYAAGTMIRTYWKNKSQFDNVVKPGNAGGNAVMPTEAETKASVEIPTEKPVDKPGDKPTETGTESPVGKPADAPVNNQPAGLGSQIADGLGITGVEVTELGYEVCDKYPEDLYAFTVDATAGKKLLVVMYDVWNSVDAPSTMTVKSEGVPVKAVINGSKQINAYKTMLKDDVLNMDGMKFEAGEAKNGVLIFMIDEDMAESITSVEVIVGK